jgi:hypothetical protein
VVLLENIEKKATKAVIDTMRDVLPKDLIFFVSYHPEVTFETEFDIIIPWFFSIGISSFTFVMLVRQSRPISSA